MRATEAKRKRERYATAQDVAHQTGFSVAEILNNLDELEQMGLVKQGQDSGDWGLTKRGIQKAKRGGIRRVEPR